MAGALCPRTTMTSSAPVLSLACVLFPLVQPLDFIGPCDILGGLAPPPPSSSATAPATTQLPVNLTITYIAESRQPLKMRGGLEVVPQLTFDEADREGREFDIILVPGSPSSRSRVARPLAVQPLNITACPRDAGGQGARPWLASNSRAQRFMKEYGPKAKYILTG